MLDHAATLLLGLLTAASTSWVGTIDHRDANWSNHDITIGTGSGAFSAAHVLHDFIDQRDEIEPASNVTLGVSLASAVGPVVSFDYSEEYDAPRAAHPGGETGILALDLRHPTRAARLDAYFPAAAIRNALAADALVKTALGKDRPAATLPALLKQLSGAGGEADGHAFSFGDSLLSRFAFHHVEGHRVAVRLALEAGSGADRYALTELGIWLDIPKAMHQDFTRATTDRTLQLNFAKTKQPPTTIVYKIPGTPTP